MNIRLRHDTQFTAGVYYRDRVIMTTFSLKLWLLTTTEDSDDQNIAFDRIRYYINSVLQNTVFIDDDKIDACRRLASANVSVTTLPSSAVDQVIGLIIHTKLNAITEGRLAVIDTEISSGFGENLVYLHGEEEDSGVAQLEGWWRDADMSHYDPAIFNTGGKVVSLPYAKQWRDVGLSWADEDDSIVFEPAATNTVIFSDFSDSRQK